MADIHAALVVWPGVAANLLFAAMFLSRVHLPSASRPAGFGGTAMAIPLAGASVVAIGAGGDAWDVALPLVFVTFAVVEVLADVVLPVDVRRTRWLWAYLATFYLAQWAVVGAAFRASPAGGGAVLVTYFVCLGATAYSLARVGHGVTRTPGA